jgi:hypothetical protein
VEEASWLEH